MKKKVMKKALAGMLATTMVLGTSMMVLAQTGDATGTQTGTGTGTFEGHVDKDVVAVTLPTSTSTTFSYKMDPEGLIAATNHAKYSDASFEDGANVYFLSKTGTWTKDSEKLRVINKGTVDVDVTVEAKTAANSNLTMAEDANFAESDTAAKLYLGLKVADKSAVAVKTDDTGKLTVGLKGNDKNFEITSTDSGYAFTAKSGVADTAWNSFEFGLTGACNPKGDYSTTGLTGSDVTVTWSYAVRADDSVADVITPNAVDKAAPSIATTEYSLTADTPVTVNVSLGGGDLAATKVTAVMNGSTALPADAWTFENGVLTITAARVNTLVNANLSKTYTVVFNDTAKTKINIVLDGTHE